MRVSLGAVLTLALVGGLAVAGPWVGNARIGFGQLLTGRFAMELPSATTRASSIANWGGAKGSAAGPSIAMSESDWLKLADDLAPVSYLPAPAEPAVPDQQPL